jgi:hypothetical protein
LTGAAIDADRRHQHVVAGQVDAVDLHYHMSSFDKSEAIHSRMRTAKSATKWREAADFETPLPAGAETSPSGNRTAGRNLRADTLIRPCHPGPWDHESSLSIPRT